MLPQIATNLFTLIGKSATQKGGETETEIFQWQVSSSKGHNGAAEPGQSQKSGDSAWPPTWVQAPRWFGHPLLVSQTHCQSDVSQREAPNLEP